MSSRQGVTQLAQPAPWAGRYEIVRPLASGGMGELFLALARGLAGVDKLVVLKRLLPHFARDEAFVRMFVNEARLAATLDHGHIVRVYELGRDTDEYFIAMEYLHGETIGRLLNAVKKRGERLPLPYALAIVIPICAGLHYAHERHGIDGTPLGIVHRDVSPGNVMITYEGGVKLLDFGIAKATARTSITTAPARKGKVAYMSPEQCVGAPVDRRSDVFSAGILLWELSTGQRLFRGDNEFAIMNAVASAEVAPPSRLLPELPAPLDAIVLRALAKDPAQRYQTALELQLDLERLVRDHALACTTTQLGGYVRSIVGERPYPSVDVAGLTPDSSSLQASASQLSAPGGRWRWAVVAAVGIALGGAAVVMATESGDAAQAPEVAPSPPVPLTDDVDKSLAQPTPQAGPVSPPPSDVPEVGRVQPRARDPKRRRRRKPRAKRKGSPSDEKMRGLDGLLPRGK